MSKFGPILWSSTADRGGLMSFREMANCAADRQIKEDKKF